MKNLLSITILALLVSLAGNTYAQTNSLAAEDITVITLNQTPGEFEIQSLELAPGNYIFEVKNVNVDHPVAFFLTENGKKPIENSGLPGLLKTGESKRSGIVTLEAGTYQYSCPLNPTPAYELVVKSE